MPYPLRAITTLLVALQICSVPAIAQLITPTGASPLLSKASVDLPYLSSDRHLCAGVYSSNTLEGRLSLSLAFYQYTAEGDSTLLCRSVVADHAFKAGTQVTKIDFTSRPKHMGDSVWCLPVFYSILQKTGAVPPGSYKTFLSVKQLSESDNTKPELSETAQRRFVFTYQVTCRLR